MPSAQHMPHDITGVILAGEVATGTGWLLWPAACAALVALLTFVLKGNFAVELAVFAVLTIASTLLARRYLPGNASGDGPDINDNVGRLVGHYGMAVSAFEHETPLLDQRVKVLSADSGILKVKAY